MRILMVCSGNTCRSPLAAAMLNAKLAAVPELAEISVASAGTSALAGAPASEGSYLIAIERGLDLSDHRSHLLTRDQVKSADLILTMTEPQAERVASLGGAMKVHTLPAFARHSDARREVVDPFGGDVEGYREVGAHLEMLLDAVIARLRDERPAR
jgi:protein-tyrosine-phosphatase